MIYGYKEYTHKLECIPHGMQAFSVHLLEPVGFLLVWRAYYWRCGNITSLVGIIWVWKAYLLLTIGIWRSTCISRLVKEFSSILSGHNSSTTEHSTWHQLNHIDIDDNLCPTISHFFIDGNTYVIASLVSFSPYLHSTFSPPFTSMAKGLLPLDTCFLLGVKEGATNSSVLFYCKTQYFMKFTTLGFCSCLKRMIYKPVSTIGIYSSNKLYHLTRAFCWHDYFI